MFSDSGSLRKFLSRFRKRDTPLPDVEQPITPEPIPIFNQDDFADEWYNARFARTGMSSILPLKNVDRYQTFVGRGVPSVDVQKGQFLTGTSLIIGSDGIAYEVSASLKVGNQYNEIDYRQRLIANFAEKNKEVEKPSSYIRDSTITTIWYLNEYRPKQIG
jgi:hypothetical protein